MRKRKLRRLTRTALIAAIYTLLTMLLLPLSFGAIQFRMAEALTILPIIMPDAVLGLFAGCLLANILGGGVWFDVALGSLATLLAAICTRKLRKIPLLAAFMPTLFNGLIVGPVVYFAYIHMPNTPVSMPVLFTTMGTVALGEVVVCYVLGFTLLAALKKLPKKLLGDE